VFESSIGLPPLPRLPTVGVGPLLAWRTRTQAAAYCTPHPLTVCCVTWNANGRLVGPDVLETWLTEALTESTTTPLGSAAAAAATAAAAAAAAEAARAAEAASAALMEQAAVAAAAAAAQQKLAAGVISQAEYDAIVAAGKAAAIAAVVDDDDEDDDEDNDEEEDEAVSAGAAGAAVAASAVAAAAAPALTPALAPTLTPEEFGEMDELINKAFLNDDESDRLQHLMAAQKRATEEAAAPLLPAQAMAKTTASFADAAGSSSGGGMGGDGMYARLRESVSPFVPQKKAVAKRCRGCGEGTVKLERETCKACGAANDWSTTTYSQSPSGTNPAAAAAAAASSPAERAYQAAGQSSAKRSGGLLGKLFAASDGEANGDGRTHTDLQEPTLAVADIIVIGLQEIVELSAANVVVESMTDTGSREATSHWVTNVNAALKQVSAKLATQQARGGRQGLLVGAPAWRGSFSYQVTALAGATRDPRLPGPERSHAFSRARA
jgi:ribosomal protein L37E